MRKKYILGGLIAFCLSQCSGCNKDSKPERKNDVREKDCLAMLKSTFANFSQQGKEVIVNLNTISSSFENLRIVLPEAWITSFDNAIKTTTTFLQSIAKKPGEKLKDKIAVLQQIVSLYTDKIEKNYKQTDQVSVVELLILGEGFQKCLEQLLDATDNFGSAFAFFKDCSLTFGALEKLFKTPKEQEEEYSKIDALFQQNYPINEMAKSILKGLIYWIPENLKSDYNSLGRLFSDHKDKNLSKEEMEAIVKETNEKIFECYKKLVELTVKKKSEDFVGSLKLGKDSKFTYFPSQKLAGGEDTIKQQTTDLTNLVFLSKYINIFQLYFSASYHLDIHESSDDTDKPKWVIKFSLDNFDPDNKNKFFTDFEGKYILKIETTTDGNNLPYVAFKNENDGSEFFTKEDPKLLTLDDKLYDGIQKLHLMLSAGFDIKNTDGQKLEKTIDPVAEHLLQTPEFSSFKEDGSVKKFEDICSTPLGSVASLWMIFKDAYDDFQIAKAANNDNKRIFHDLWTLRNTAHYIKTSCDKYLDDTNPILGGDRDKFVENLLTSILEGQEGDDDNTQIPGISDFWTTFLDMTEEDFKHTAVQLALAEYFVMRCGLFNKDVLFNISDNSLKTDPGMSYDNMHTFGLYKWIKDDVLKVTPEDIITTDLDNFFKIGQTIKDNATTLGREVFDKHINKGKNRLKNFLNVRNKFYSSYPEGIYNLKDKEAIKNFLIDVARVAQAADKVKKNPKEVGNPSLKWVVDNILDKVYGSANILKHVETCFATNEEECKKYIAAYWMKFVRHLLEGNVVMDFEVAPICQRLGRINNVDDAKNINLEGIIKDNRKKRILKRETNNTNNELTQPSPFNNNELYTGYVSEKGVGIDAIIADICQIVKENWTIISPRFDAKKNVNDIITNRSIEKWFKDFKIYVYTLAEDPKKYLSVSDPVINPDTFFKNDVKCFTLRRNLWTEIFVDSSTDDSEEKINGLNKDGEHVARSISYTFPKKEKSQKILENVDKDKAPLTQMFYNITSVYSKYDGLPDPWDVDNIKFLSPLFGMDDIIKRTIKGFWSQDGVPGFIFKFDYYGYSDLYGKYDIKEEGKEYKHISKNDWIRVQNCQM